ncbi:MAG: phosphate acyltransferase PlsX [Candidatus Saelkia tenebricola]|nr:phosphate acyltransferase PlsX [Candidatus Saelkia tenebricola]
MKARIALDAMGGDFAPLVCVKGAELAVREDSEIEVILVGREDEIKSSLNKHPQIKVVHAEEFIDMDESPAISVRRKKDSSINKAISLLKDGQADVFISAGNTGAVVCAASLILRLLPDIERPGIAIIFPTTKGFCLLIDVGANIDPKPMHLYQYGIMGSAYTELILKKNNPTVGLLNIGEEESKGTDFMKEVNQLLKECSLNYKGNIEGRDLFLGKYDVVVADGFVGNIALKVSESVAIATGEILKKHIKDGLLAKLGALMLMPTFKKIKKDIDYTEYGGAPLLGVDGNVVICHGSSSDKAIKNAIKVAKEMVEKDVKQKIKERLHSL